MELERLSAEAHSTLEAILGYLNFSAGATDARFLRNLNEAYRLFLAASDGPGDADPADRPWDALCGALTSKLDLLEGQSDTFRDVAQARLVLQQTHGHVLPAYREFHHDLLAHQDERCLFGPFFLGRAYEAVLKCRNNVAEAVAEAGGQVPDGFVDDVLRVLNDYLGYRPVATLETSHKLEPYPHERCRPIPLYIRGAGAACGRYESLIAKTIEILEATDPALLDAAYFDPARLEELAIDPRAYDFDHPANKRPNYQFGTWDLHRIDNQGYYRRFVAQQVTLDALIERVEQAKDDSGEQLLFESAAAFAGTILMASGITGSGPDSHTSDVSLGNLLPRIAAFRDAFYDQLLAGHGNESLVAEAKHLRQPFGGVRQCLNAELARQRASHLEHVHLARLYARMGYPEASARQVAMVPTPAARMACKIQCHLTAAQRQLDAGQLDEAVSYLPRIVDLVHRGIQCGAMIDPWNILGFDANFSLFPAVENTVHDHRADELNELMEEIFALYSRAWCLAAAANAQEAVQTLAKEFRELATWWDQFAVVTVTSVDGVAAGLLYDAAEAAAAALSAWNEAGTQAGDTAFWQPHVDQFESPKAYVLVLSALIDQRDFVASMGVLIHWLNHADEVGLQRGTDLFQVVATRWLDGLLTTPASTPDEAGQATSRGSEDAWRLVRKFFDYVEANAEEYWQVPQFELTTTDDDFELEDELAMDEDEDEDEEEDELYAAAYDEMVYRDSTDDGIDSELLGDGQGDTDYELELEARRLSDRLAFLTSLARFWKRTALSMMRPQQELTGQPPTEHLSHWTNQLLENRSRLITLLRAVAGHHVPLPGSDPVSMMEYDRRRMVKDALLDRIVVAYIASTEAAQFLMAAGAPEETTADEPELRVISTLLRAAVAGKAPAARQQYRKFVEHLENTPILYIPLAKGGDPQRAAVIRARQRALRLMLAILPRLGLLKETCQLIERCADVERHRPVGPGAVTEFDQLFRIGYQGMVDCLVTSSEQWQQEQPDDQQQASRAEADEELVEYLQHLTELMMERWLEHSRTVRLSVLEKIANQKQWKGLRKFIQQYGHELFDQSFFHLGNLRAILHRGVDAWLDELAEIADEQDIPLLAVLHDTKARQNAVHQLQLIMESIVENYVEYRDYNGTTTQSDRGELLFTLLDMLRLRVSYDRVAWNLMPVSLAHEVLVRRGHTVAAEFWRREMARRTSEMADQLLDRFSQLQREYGMRLQTVAVRVKERFVRPLLVDRARALVRPAIAEATGSQSSAAFEQFAEQLAELTREPTGVGLDVPDWLEEIEEEVELAQDRPWQHDQVVEVATFVEQRCLSRGQLQRQLGAMES